MPQVTPGGYHLEKTMNYSEWICRLFGFLMASAICFSVGCNGGASQTVGNNTDMIVFTNRMKTGRFQAFKIEDQAVIERTRKALQEDLRRPDKLSNLGLGMSVNHLLVLRDKDGTFTSFEILGDEYLLVESTRYPAQRTIEVLKDARAGGAAHPISAEEARGLVSSSVRDYYLQ